MLIRDTDVHKFSKEPLPCHPHYIADEHMISKTVWLTWWDIPWVTIHKKLSSALTKQTKL